MFTIFICNSLIINRTFKDDSHRKSLRLVRANNPVKKAARSPSSNFSSVNNASSVSNDLSNKESKRERKSNLKKKPHYLTLNQIINRNKRNSQNNSKKITILLIFISFSFIFLNLPYLLSWLLYSYDETFNKLDINTQNYLFTAIQISEIFYVLNYGIKFFVYCASGSKFNNQLKYSSIFLEFCFLASKNSL